uniref:G-protein coupled receptors family 1 profile domain-containing protein n=1 Tax=Acrobeloides nanus TaxID=290746 RepID=A0A914BUA0_9BILA
MIAVSLLAILFSLPRFFEVTTVYECPAENLSKCIPRVTRTSLPMNITYWTIYHIVLGMLFVTLVPCLILLGLTLRISLALRTAIVKRKELCPPEKDLDDRNKKSSSTRKEHQANIMLVLVIVKFLISDIFPTVADVAEHMVGYETFMNSRIATLFVDLSNFLVVLNCSTNFWIFLFWGKRFRRGCRYIFAVSPLGRALHHCTRTTDSEYASNGYHRPSLFAPNFPSSRVCSCSERKMSSTLKPTLPRDITSTTVMVISENGYLQEPLLKNNNGIDMMGRMHRPRSYSGPVKTSGRVLAMIPRGPLGCVQACQQSLTLPDFQ